MLYKYFYAIMRDGQIIELKYNGELLKAISDAMTNKALITLKEYGVILNGVDISKVLTEEKYDDYIFMINPKQYIKEGIWRDGKEHKIIRYAKWKQEEIDARKKLQQSEEFTETPEQREKVNEMIRKLAEQKIIKPSV